MKNFALIGAGGYVAPRHLNAIKETGNNLLAVLDINTPVAALDEYFPGADRFTEFEEFERHLEKQKKSGVPVD
jgi:UDP-N-acetyl-2-amino-2-deoxyglucuronate dehydrogenase